MNVPKLRFKEFDGELIKYNIEQLVEVTDCKHDTAPVEAEKTIYKMIRTGNVRNGNLLVETMDSVSEDTFHKWSLRGYLEPNDIILTREAPMGEVAIIPKNSKYNFFLGQRCLQLKSNAELADSVYIYFLLQGKRFQKYIRPLKSSGSTVSNIRIPELKSFEFEIPDIKEQIKVGDFLGEINKKIQLQQQKIDLLQEQKKGFLQKMFPKAGETQPEMRFDGFTEDWVQHKLGDYIIQYNEVTTENNQYPVFTSSRKGLFFQKDYYDGNQIASEDNTGYNIVPRGYFTYRHMSDDLIFKFNINNLADYGIVSTLYPVFTTTEELDSNYLQYQLNEGEEFKRFSILQKQGGSRTYMYLSKLKNLTLTMPNIEEQRKLNNFFMELDKTIALHQKKLDLYREQKMGFMQQMFI